MQQVTNRKSRCTVYSTSANGIPLLTQRPGLREIEDGEDKGKRIVPDWKRVICSVSGINALYGGYVDCCSTEMLVDTGAVVSLMNKSVFARIGRATTSLRPYSGSLNNASGHGIKTLGVIDLPVRLESVEKELPFIMTNSLHVDAILGTDSLSVARVVVGHETRTMRLKDTGVQVRAARAEETYAIGVTSNATATRSPASGVF
ncbi:hypothetical protein PC120_g20826 [Phytophthora cactorum]|nr:hypothetical protein PC120_g20826 [Phytophthora cactorum]